MASEKQNKISVIIPVYKTERFLAAALDSLVAQTYENWEAVCVNDGSPDNCIDILKEYSKRDNRIK
ncbi:MAG: glycosyltransferase, partial [Bacteroidales bacterium]|nr:glycosyltransferase [Bacteroidales bacterium]